jgi:hypothetical protein
MAATSARILGPNVAGGWNLFVSSDRGLVLHASLSSEEVAALFYALEEHMRVPGV